jgi:gliding motility-associated-like protein
MRSFLASLLLLTLFAANVHGQTNAAVTPQMIWTYSPELSEQELYQYERLLYMSREDWDLFRADSRYNDERVREIYRSRKGELVNLSQQLAAARQSGNDCNCWIEPDETYTLTDPTNWPNCGGGGPGVDCWLSPITLPFSFCFFGQNFNQIVLTSKGTIVFGSNGYFDWTPSEFPNPTGGGEPQYDQICGFWADFDFRQTGEMYYKVTPHAFYLNYIDAGYWSNHIDKKNTFQITLTDGTDILPGGNNVQFCYRDMQWAHGDVTGNGGFGGQYPAQVGADRATGNSHVQYGRFNLNSAAYNGPYGQAAAQQDGVNWLDNRVLNFTTCFTGNNVPPLATQSAPCDTIYLCLGDVYDLTQQFLSPETAQQTTITATQTGTGLTFSATNGNIATLNASFAATASNPGTHTVTITATDNGATPSSTVLTYVFVVNNIEAPDVTIDGNLTVCAGGTTTLTASSGFDSYSWSTGCDTQACDVTTNGNVTVTATYGNCSTSATVTVDATAYFIPALLGGNTPVTLCSNETATLCLADEWSSVQWGIYPGYDGDFVDNTPLNQTCVEVTGAVAGNYQVIVTDENGCQGFNIATTNTILSYIDPINEENSRAYCDGLESVSFTGGFSNPAVGNFVVYCFGGVQGWQGSYLNVTVTHLNGTTDSYIMTTSGPFLVNSCPITVGDEITVTYVSSGNDTGNYIQVFNCSNTGSQTINPLSAGVVWTGTSACTAQPLFGTWSVTGPAGWNMTSTTQYNTVFTPSVAGSYELCFTDPSCANAYCYQLDFASAPDINLVINNAQLLCGNETLNACATLVDASNSSEIFWSGNGVVAGADPLCAVAGPYNTYMTTTVQVSAVNACGTDTDSFQLEHQNNVPTPQLGDQFLCSGTSAVLDPVPASQDDPNLVYDWNPGTSTNSTLTVTQSGTYSVTISNDCGTSTQAISQITIIPAATVNPLPADVPVCNDDNYLLSINVPAGYSVTWSPNGETTSAIDVTESGTYCYDVTDNAGCNTHTTGCSNVLITHVPVLVPASGNAIVLCPGACESIDLVSDVPATYTWSSDCAGVPTTGQTTSSVQLCSDQVPSACLETGLTLTGTATNICGSASNAYFIATNQCFLLIPNVISDNGDSKNARFYIDGLRFYKNAHLQIFDRWGALIFEDTDYGARNNWAPAGNFSAGTYFYVLTLPVGLTREFKGTFTLLKEE